MSSESTPTLRHSYAQNFEDVWLWRAFGHLGTGFYVDVGAFDPEEDSVTKLFYDRGWSGINIEPGPRFPRFETSRPRDVNLNVAIAEKPGTIEFVHNVKTPGWSTLAAHHGPDASRGHRLGVSATTLRRVLDEHLGDRLIHFLKVDVEGAEPEVLASNDWDRFRPELLIIEATEPGTNIPTHGGFSQLLEAAGYTDAHFDGINRFYVRAESQGLLDVFATPVNPIDGFVRAQPALYRDLERLRRRNEELEATHQRLLTDLVPPGNSRTLQYGLIPLRVSRRLYWELGSKATRASVKVSAARTRLRKLSGNLRTARPAQVGAGPIPPVLIDVTHVNETEIKTGIQRVVSSMCREWPDQQVGLVRIDGRGEFRLLEPTRSVSIHSLFSSGAKDRRPGAVGGEYKLSHEEVRTRTVICPELFSEPSRLEAYRRLLTANPEGVFFIVYDLIPWRFPRLYDPGFTGAFGRYVEVVRHARNVSFISDEVRDDFTASVARGSSPNFVMIPLGVDAMGQAAPASVPPGNRTFVTVGTVEPRKNHGLMLQAYDQLRSVYPDLELVVVCQQDWNTTAAADLQRRSAEGQGIRWLKGLGDEETSAIIRGARATMCASFTEGFGLPIVESLALGVPVIAFGELPAVKSVGGKGILALETLEAGELAGTMELVLNDPVWRAKAAEISALRLPTWQEFGKAFGEWVLESSRIG